MTTARSPLRVLKAQADHIADVLKTAERGEKVGNYYAEKIEAARGKDAVTFGIVMDDKIVKIIMPWSVIRETSEVALAEYVLNQMREARISVQ